MRRKTSLFHGAQHGEMPGGHSLLFVRAADEHWPAMAPIWNELRAELERRGWLEMHNRNLGDYIKSIPGVKMDIVAFSTFLERLRRDDLTVTQIAPD
jgi:hypothetical protein